MKKSDRWMAVALTVMAAVTGCCLNDKETPVLVIDPVTDLEGISLTRAEQDMVNCSNEFAFNLFRQLTGSHDSGQGQDTKSYVVSPISVIYALGMLNNGAANNTQAQINKVLGFGDTGADSINVFCRKMLNSAPQLDSLTKVLIANTIYLNKGYTLKSAFVQKAKSFYNAEPETRDFDDGQTMDVINKWASDHTEGMISRILNENSFNPYAVSYLLNAIYFKGTWKYKFDRDHTEEAIFQHAGSSEELRIVPMMYQTGDFRYTQTEDLQVLCLPYGNGSFQMTILLPVSDDEGYSKMPQIPDAETWNRLNKSMETTQVAVRLPVFETNTDIDLKAIMTQLGMPDAFDGNIADFSNFCDSPTYIGLMKQVARIKLDEEGSEAAAVTVIGVDNCIGGSLPQYVFNADHPFLYVISESSTGAILFIGRYTSD